MEVSCSGPCLLCPRWGGEPVSELNQFLLLVLGQVRDDVVPEPGSHLPVQELYHPGHGPSLNHLPGLHQLPQLMSADRPLSRM